MSCSRSPQPKEAGEGCVCFAPSLSPQAKGRAGEGLPCPLCGLLPRGQLAQRRVLAVIFHSRPEFPGINAQALNSVRQVPWCLRPSSRVSPSEFWSVSLRVQSSARQVPGYQRPSSRVSRPEFPNINAQAFNLALRVPGYQRPSSPVSRPEFPNITAQAFNSALRVPEYQG